MEQSGTSYEQAKDNLENASTTLFQADPRVRSVGIGRHGQAFGYRAVRNSALVLPMNAAIATMSAVNDVPVAFIDTPQEIRSLVVVADSGTASPALSTLVPEVQMHRPLVCGLQIQNIDDDLRQRIRGALQSGFIVVGTLGCFVKLSDGRFALLSNNHVVAGENRGVKATDRILQPGNGAFVATEHVATLTDFVPIVSSPPGAQPTGGVVFNQVDAGIAALEAGVAHKQQYLTLRKGVIAPHAVTRARVGDSVFKVGRTTGLTRGTVVSVHTIVGPIPYDIPPLSPAPFAGKPCWFQDSLEIEGVNGTLFSDHGDSGSLIVRDSGEAVGLLYAGNGQQTYACPLDTVLTNLNCSLA